MHQKPSQPLKFLALSMLPSLLFSGGVAGSEPENQVITITQFEKNQVRERITLQPLPAEQCQFLWADLVQKAYEKRLKSDPSISSESRVELAVSDVVREYALLVPYAVPAWIQAANPHQKGSADLARKDGPVGQDPEQRYRPATVQGEPASPRNWEQETHLGESR